MDTQPGWVLSRFNFWARSEDGGLLIYNSLSGAFVQLWDADAELVADLKEHSRQVIEPRGVLAALTSQGILVRTTSDELRRATLLHESRFRQRDQLHLILMPTEQCNFRCVYCYEEFKLGRMPADVIDSIVNLVQCRAADLRYVSVNWFGGEPLIAADIVEGLSRRLIALCDEAGIEYSAGMTTNGYLLNREKAEMCRTARISDFQVTLDGVPESHNRQRLLAGGGETFDTILDNLRLLRDRADEFRVNVRVNFAPAGVVRIPEFLRSLADEFGGDPRFRVLFRPVGRWGGENDHNVSICDRSAGEDHEIEFTKLAAEAGFHLEAWRDALKPFGSSCYAADPRSFVIGSDGTVYKCTVAFQDPRNRIGKIALDGSLNIDEDLHSLWTSSGEEVDQDCQQCGFRPACQGNHCPLERLNNDGQKTCPSVKRNMETYLPVLAAVTVKPLPVVGVSG